MCTQPTSLLEHLLLPADAGWNTSRDTTQPSDRRTQCLAPASHPRSRCPPAHAAPHPSPRNTLRLVRDRSMNQVQEDRMREAIEKYRDTGFEVGREDGVY